MALGLSLATLSLLLVGGGVLFTGDTADRNGEPTSAAMRDLFASIRVLLPLTVRAEEFAAPENAPRLRESLSALERSARALGAHGRDQDPAMQFYRDHLVRDARRTRQHFESGRYESTRFHLWQLTDSCVACHSRLPSPGDSPVAKDFVGVELLSVLEPESRASLQIATRRFDDAQRTLEALLRSQVDHPADLLGPLTDYLVICLRVRGDVERPIAVLEAFAQRPDLWINLRADVDAWLETLRRLRARPLPAATVSAARTMIEEIPGGNLPGADRHGLVQYVLASGLLQRSLDRGMRSDRERAAAYYWLGVTEARIGRSYWLSQANFYLETAIRLDPAGPLARDAYGLLEEKMILSNRTESGVHLPEESVRLLDELRALIERS